MIDPALSGVPGLPGGVVLIDAKRECVFIVDEAGVLFITCKLSDRQGLLELLFNLVEVEAFEMARQLADILHHNREATLS